MFSKSFSCSIIFHFFPTETARNPTIGRPSSFDVDTSGAGLGELAIQCRGPVGNVPVDVKPTAPGRYNVSFTPNKPGEYNIHFVFNGDDIPGSPVKTIVSDPSRIVAHGDGLHQVRRQVLFIIIPLSSFGSLGQTRFFAVISVTHNNSYVCPRSKKLSAFGPQKFTIFLENQRQSLNQSDAKLKRLVTRPIAFSRTSSSLFVLTLISCWLLTPYRIHSYSSFGLTALNLKP